MTRDVRRDIIAVAVLMAGTALSLWGTVALLDTLGWPLILVLSGVPLVILGVYLARRVRVEAEAEDPDAGSLRIAPERGPDTT